MRPDLKTFRVNDRYLIGASLDMRVIVLQPDARSVAFDVDLQADCGNHFFLSENGWFLVAAFGFEAFSCVEVIDLRRNVVIPPAAREKATMIRFDRVHAMGVRLAPSGNTLLYSHAARPEGRAVHLPSGQQVKLPNTKAPTNGAWLADDVILPMRRGRGGVRVSYWPLVIRSVELPSRENVWRMTEHPGGMTVLMLDALSQVASLRADTLTPLWQRCLSEADWISYSGDGRFIAVRQRAPAGGPVERIAVLDASSGQTVRTIEHPEQALFPLDGPRFLCYSGRFLNAETGEFEEGVSAPGFWNKFLTHR